MKTHYIYVCIYICVYVALNNKQKFWDSIPSEDIWIIFNSQITQIFPCCFYIQISSPFWIIKEAFFSRKEDTLSHSAEE